MAQYAGFRSRDEDPDAKNGSAGSPTRCTAPTTAYASKPAAGCWSTTRTMCWRPGIFASGYGTRPKVLT